jgi:hypothetical protein
MASGLLRHILILPCSALLAHSVLATECPKRPCRTRVTGSLLTDVAGSFGDGLAQTNLFVGRFLRLQLTKVTGRTFKDAYVPLTVLRAMC